MEFRFARTHSLLCWPSEGRGECLGSGQPARDSAASDPVIGPVVDAATTHRGISSTSLLRLRLRSDVPAARMAAHEPPPAADRREQPPGLSAAGSTCAPFSDFKSR
jgi:hypothetical protein